MLAPRGARRIARLPRVPSARLGHTLDLGLHMTHEGDGENLQVVVEKSSGEVVLLFTHAHYCGSVYASTSSGFGDREKRIRGELILVDESGRPSEAGTHAAVFVESKGHGILGVSDESARIDVGADARARFDGQGVIFLPAKLDEPAAEPSAPIDAPVPYRLESTSARLWPALARGELTGEGQLLDGCIPCRDARVTIDLPRYHAGDRFSGPLGPHRGISPFAVDFHWDRDWLGSLFFDPARRYAECLEVPSARALDYVNLPFGEAEPSQKLRVER